MPVPKSPSDAAGQVLTAAHIGDPADCTERRKAQFLKRDAVKAFKLGRQRVTSLSEWLKYIERMTTKESAPHEAMMRGEEDLQHRSKRGRPRRNGKGEVRAIR